MSIGKYKKVIDKVQKMSDTELKDSIMEANPQLQKNEEQFDIKDGSRIYYYNILGKMMPDYESMMAYLLDEGILFAAPACAKYDGDKECVGLFININDYFIPASDSEAVTYDELPKLYEMYKERKYDGVSQFVADKRGIPNIYWRDEDSDFRKAVKDKLNATTL